MKVFLFLVFSFSFGNALAFQSDSTSPPPHFLIASVDAEFIELIKEHRAIMQQRMAQPYTQNQAGSTLLIYRPSDEPPAQSKPSLSYYDPPVAQSKDPSPLQQDDFKKYEAPLFLSPVQQPQSYGSFAGDSNPVNNPTYEKECTGSCKEMAYCLTRVQEVLNERKRKELIKRDPSAKGHISCEIGGSYFVSSVWYSRYPVKGICHDKRKGGLGYGFGLAGYNEDISDSEKNKRVKDCNSHLNKLTRGENPTPPAPAKPKPIEPEPYDLKAEKMAKCLSDIERLLIKDQKRQLLARGTKSEDINCSLGFFSANSSIWYLNDYELPYPDCYDTTKPFGLSNNKAFMARDISENEKNDKLKWCQNQLKNLSKEPYDPKAVELANCRSDMDKLIISFEQGKLISEGSQSMNIFCEKGQKYRGDSSIWGFAGYNSGFCNDFTSKKLIPSSSSDMRGWFSGGPSLAEKDKILNGCKTTLENTKELQKCKNSSVFQNGKFLKSGSSCVDYKTLLSMPNKSIDQQIVMIKNCNNCLGLDPKEFQKSSGQR